VALAAAGVGPGDEVILPPFTWPQTLTPVVALGATPVFADIGEGTVTLDPRSVKEQLSPRTRAILAVYLFGIPADVRELNAIATAAGCSLVIDAAQGFGATIDRLPAGAFGDYVAFSFGRSKLLTAGEGGALACRTNTHYERAVALSQHPFRIHRDVNDATIRKGGDGVTMNFRLHPLVASLAHGQLRGLRSRRVVHRLQERFATMVDRVGREIGNGQIPEWPEYVTPSGVALPLLSATDREAAEIVRDGAENGWAEASGLSTPLYACATIRQHHFHPVLPDGGHAVNEHATHCAAACPHTAIRVRAMRLVLRQQMNCVLQASL